MRTTTFSRMATAVLASASSSHSSLNNNNNNEDDPYAPHWTLYPRTYIVRPCTDTALLDHVNGDLSKAVWANVSWSETFGDIQGQDAPENATVKPATTKFKAVYDKTHLYIGAILEPAAANMSTEAHFVQRNEPIYQNDSDFEVFVDCYGGGGTNHHYKELEINALNTVWNLMLDKPYADGGTEHSGRIAKPGDSNYYEVYQQKTAVRVLQGRLNDPNGKGARWSVEAALAFSDLLAGTTNNDTPPPPPPRPGQLWRINFSRVERKGQINWTWQSQTVRWNPQTRQFQGYIDMHMPDSWGYLYFAAADAQQDANAADDDDNGACPRDPSWPARLAAMCVYYAQHYHKDTTGSFSRTVDALILPQAIVAPFQVDVQVEKGNGSKDGQEQLPNPFIATVWNPADGTGAMVTNDRLLTVITSSTAAEDDEGPPTTVDVSRRRS